MITPLKTHSLLQLIKTLSDVLYHGANSAVVRQQAGVQLKNFLYTNDESLRAQYEQRWLEMPEEVRVYLVHCTIVLLYQEQNCLECFTCDTLQVRVYTKNNVLGSLGTESFRPSAAAQCIQLIAMAELPRQMWPNLLTTLVQVRTINLFSNVWVVQLLYFTLSRM